eukprot:CAMPEP_0180793718 /NCGR_PEP_ID=MMETSP1038_2-20121128/55175_1 /TAXON_ID=632150 /ORGANISM="Azadinium spinosum, Strain 3D9" /LENGTH=34 /DNA_ID= /DNA_START= /DNA_END= /DNA_ORIENTATION=
MALHEIEDALHKGTSYIPLVRQDAHGRRRAEPRV